MSGLLKRELEREFAQLEKAKSSEGRKRPNKKLAEKLPTNRHGIRKNRKRLQEGNSRPKFGGSAGKKLKFSFLELESKKNSDEKNEAKVEAGVAKLLNISKSSRSSAASAVFEQHEKLHRHYIPKSRNFLEKFQKKKKVEPEGTVFTEEDFEKFSKEYFVNSKPVNSTTLVSKPRFDE